MSNSLVNVSVESAKDSMVSVFSNADFGSIRTIEIDGSIWFVGKDIADALGYEASRNAIANHVDDDDKLTHKISASGQMREMTIINESGVYSLILSSKLPKAKDFKRWVTSEVLPSIRKNGKYDMNEPIRKPYQPSEYEVEKLKNDKANLWLRIADNYNGKSRDYKDICNAYAAKELAGKFVLPLPETDKTYSATEVGELLGISANKVGKIANDNNLKTEEYGHWVSDKSRYSSKEVSCFRYNEKGVKRISDLIKLEK